MKIFNHLFSSLIIHASKWKISHSFSFPFSIFSSSPYSISALPNTTYMWLSKRHQLFWMLLSLFSHVWLVIEDSQVTTIALISVSPSVTNYHTACSLIHVLDNAISLEAKKTGHSMFKKYPIIIHFFPPSFLLFFDRPPPLFTQLFFFYAQNVFIIVCWWSQDKVQVGKDRLFARVVLRLKIISHFFFPNSKVADYKNFSITYT